MLYPKHYQHHNVWTHPKLTYLKSLNRKPIHKNDDDHEKRLFGKTVYPSFELGELERNNQDQDQDRSDFGKVQKEEDYQALYKVLSKWNEDMTMSKEREEGSNSKEGKG